MSGMTRKAVTIRHVPVEDLGSFERVLSANGFAIEYRDAITDDFAAIDPLAPDLLVVMGGPVGVYEQEIYPFLKDELRLLERRFKANKPTLGVCLGSQLMASALGARVYPGGRKELGWSPVSLTEAGERSALRHVAPALTPVVHWHGDTFDLPDGAVRLASTSLYANQAFAWGDRALALQFHPEVTESLLERWFISCGAEIASVGGMSVQGLRDESKRWCPVLEPQARLLLEEWLRGACN